MSSQYHLKVRKSSILVIMSALDKMEASEDLERTKKKVANLYEKVLSHEKKQEEERTAENADK